MRDRDLCEGVSEAILAPGHPEYCATSQRRDSVRVERNRDTVGLALHRCVSRPPAKPEVYSGRLQDGRRFDTHEQIGRITHAAPGTEFLAAQCELWHKLAREDRAMRLANRRWAVARILFGLFFLYAPLMVIVQRSKERREGRGVVVRC